MILMGDFYRCDSWSKVLGSCENQVSRLQSQPGHSKIITQILKNNEIGLENKMGLDIRFVCLMVLLPFASMYSSFPLSSPSQQGELETVFYMKTEFSHKSPDFRARILGKTDNLIRVGNSYK